MPCGPEKSRGSTDLLALPRHAPTHLCQPLQNTHADSDPIVLEIPGLSCQNRHQGRVSNGWIDERIGNNFVYGAGQRVLFNLLFFRRRR